MMNRLLHTDEVRYFSELNKASLIQKVEELFAKRTLGLTGKLIDENEFRASDNQVVIGWDIPGVERKSAYLKGRITDGEKGALINLKVNPNLTYHYFAVVAILAGLILALISVIGADNSVLLFILGLVFMGSGLTYLVVGIAFRNRLRNKLVKYLDLRKV